MSFENTSESMTQYFEQKLSNYIDGTVHIIYRAYSTNNNDVPIDNLDDVAIQGPVIFSHLLGSEDYGVKNSYMSEEVYNPTWLDICILANEMIVTTGNIMVPFLDGVIKIGENRYEFDMGCDMGF